MSILRHPIFLVAATLFLVNQAMEQAGYYLPVIHAWLDDLLCIPVMLTLVLAFQRRITYRDPHYRFSIGHVVVAVIHISILFEWLIPQYTDRFTADPLDVIAYALGGLIFYYGINGAQRVKMSV